MSFLPRQRRLRRQEVAPSSALQFDEASSGGSTEGGDADDDSESNVDDWGTGAAVAAVAGAGRVLEQPAEESSEGEGSDDDEDEDDQENSVTASTDDDKHNDSDADEAGGEGPDTEPREAKTRRDEYYEDSDAVIGNNSKQHGGGDDDDSSSSSSTDHDVPLHERMRRKEEQGLLPIMKLSRERKSRALELASERLAALQKMAKNDTEGNKKRKMTDEKGQVQEKGSSDANITKKKKKSKHRPTEVSSKRADFFRRGAPKLNESGVGVEIGAHRYKPLDPRMSNLTGHFNEEQFHKNYAFLEEMRNQEIGHIRKRIAARRTTGDRGRKLRRKLGITSDNTGSLDDDEARLKVLTQDRAALERRKVELTAKQTVKRNIQEEVASGKRGAFFLKRKEKKRLEMEAKLEEIRKRGGNKAVEKMLDRKRRKNKSRDAGMFAK